MMSTESTAPPPAAAPRWHPIGPTERRVLGALVEKAKTTPENYPLSLNALRTACNQKSNRSPQMQLEEPQVEEALDELRKVGAALLVQGDSRVDRYRHLAYDWLGVDKVELAVMAELLLRGAQTVGELRGRAARMEPIKDLAELQPVLASLEAKKLIAYLTPRGRGAVVSHTLYLDREMEKVRREASALPVGRLEADDEEAEISALTPQRPEITTAPRGPDRPPPLAASAVAAEVQQLREQVTQLKRELEQAISDWSTVAAEIRHQLTELNRQLGN
jgi:uncharacterized protein YceH (UPF0502 family)